MKNTIKQFGIIAFVTVMGFSCGGSSSSSSSRNNGGNSDKIPNGTYVRSEGCYLNDDRYMTPNQTNSCYYTFSGKKFKFESPQKGDIEEGTYELIVEKKEKDFSSGKIIFTYSSGYTNNRNYILEGNKLTLSYDYTVRGGVFTKK